MVLTPVIEVIRANAPGAAAEGDGAGNRNIVGLDNEAAGSHLNGRRAGKVGIGHGIRVADVDQGGLTCGGLAIRVPVARQGPIAGRFRIGVGPTIPNKVSGMDVADNCTDYNQTQHCCELHSLSSFPCVSWLDET